MPRRVRLATLAGAALLVAACSLVKGETSPMETATNEPPLQYVFKTIGERRLTADVSYPDHWRPDDKRPAIVFWAGGAFRTGGTTQFEPQAQYFARRGLVAIRAEYRGKVKDNVGVVECLKDAISSMRWVRENAPTLGVDPNRIVASGGSAGGYLAAAVWTTEDLHSPSDNLAVSPKPNAMVLFNPALGFGTKRTPARADQEEERPSVELPSPLAQMKEGMPPAIILIGSGDQFLAGCKEFCEKGKALGARMEIEIYEGQTHAFFNESPWTETTALRADEFLRSIGYLTDEPKADPPQGNSPGTRQKKQGQKRQKAQEEQ